MRNRPVVVMALVLLLSGAASEGKAQTTVFGGVSVASLWDDETFLGINRPKSFDHEADGGWMVGEILEDVDPTDGS